MRVDLAGLAARLERVADGGLLRAAAERGAAVLADEVRARLSGKPGGAHETPWLETGALRDSIGISVSRDGDGVRAMVGSSDPAAVPQELGTAHMAARPFLAPAAAELGEDVARAVGEAAAEGLGGGR